MTKTLNRKTMPVGPIAANCSVVWKDPAAAAIVDPGADAERIVRACEGAGVTPVAILLTHGHFDHIGAIPALLARWPDLPVHLGPGDVPMIGHPMNGWEPDYPVTPRPASLAADLVEGAVLAFGEMRVSVLATPGHTPGGVCLYLPDDGLLFSGDTLFAGSCGRTDFPGGDMGRLQASLKRLATLPGETTVVCGHGVGTTIADEIRINPFLHGAV